MLFDIYDGKYSDLYFSVDTQKDFEFILNEVKRRFLNKDYAYKGYFESRLTETEAMAIKDFIKRQRSSDTAVMYSKNNETWHEYLQNFWEPSFRHRGFQSDFYRDSFYKDKELLSLLALYYRDPDDDLLNRLHSSLKEQEDLDDKEFLVFTAFEDLYNPSYDFVLSHLGKYLLKDFEEQDKNISWDKERLIASYKKRFEMAEKILKKNGIKVESPQEIGAVFTLFEECIKSFYDSDAYRSSVETVLVRNADICEKIDEVFENLHQNEDKQ